MSQMASLVAYATIFLNNILNYLLKGEYVMMMMMTNHVRFCVFLNVLRAYVSGGSILPFNRLQYIFRIVIRVYANSSCTVCYQINVS